MPTRIFSFNGNHFDEVKSNLADMYGWWQSIAAADVNADGKTDLIIGNIGENFYLHPEKNKPVKLYMGDVDNNGDIDKILTRTFDGKDRPVFLKNDLQEQIPSIKKENLKHHDYAMKSIDQLLRKEVLKKMVVKDFNYSASCIAINNGDGNFTIQKMHYRAQLSSVNAIHCMDVNKDGFMDIVTAGNNSGFLPQLEKLDASFGDVFINNGKGHFTWMKQQQTGLRVDGVVRDIKEIKTKNKNYLLFLKNDDYPSLYQIKN
jgi:hypothetical protein